MEAGGIQANVTGVSDGIGSSVTILDEAANTLRGLYGGELDSLAIERLVVGVFFVGVKLSNGCGGVAYTPPEVVRSAGIRILKGSAPLIRGMRAAEAMAGELPSPFAGVIRLATLNALSAPLFEGGRYCVDTSGDASGMASLFRNRRVCMVGAIIPLLKRLKELNPAEVSIIDRKTETREEAEAGYGVFVPPERTAETIARCETAVFTGAAIANNSIEQLIRFVPRDAALAVVGPTAGFVPEPLYRRNAAMVGTVVVTDIDQALEVLGEGGGGYRLFGTCMRKINLINTERLRLLGLDAYERHDTNIPPEGA